MVKRNQLVQAVLTLWTLASTITFPSVSSKGSTSEKLENVTQTITRLLLGYDIRLRPNFGGDPLYVGMDLTIASFDHISEVNMDYTITMYLNQYWKDDRLAFSSNDEVLTLSGDFAEKIWVPDTFFANDKNSFLHDVTEKNKMVRLYGDGSITYGMRFTTTLACMMDLHYYPLDSQNCTVEIESCIIQPVKENQSTNLGQKQYGSDGKTPKRLTLTFDLADGYTVTDVVMYWKDKPVMGVNDADLPQFTIVDYETNDRTENLATGIYQRLSLSFKLQRNIGYFIFQTYLPSILIVMLSWVSFWINHEATSARVALGITTVLTMTTISTGVRSSLPRISYVKAIDIYLVMCFVFVFAALLEYAAVNYTYWGARAKKKIKQKRNKAGTPTKRTDQQIFGNEEIIELEEFQLSPIPSIRQRNFGSRTDAGLGAGSSSPRFPPSFRIHRPHHNPTSIYASTTSARLRSRRSSKQSGVSGSHSGPKMLQTIRRGASALKNSLPKIRDVNVIDKFSRVVFPVSFICFNAFYWSFYFL